MDILGIGPLELIAILLIALAVFGPDRLPAIGAKLGRGLRDMRKATREFSRELEAARKAVDANTAEIKEPMQEIGGAVQGAAALAQAMRNPGQAVRDAVMRELTQAPATEEVAENVEAHNDSGATAPPLIETSVLPPEPDPELTPHAPPTVPTDTMALPADAEGSHVDPDGEETR